MQELSAQLKGFRRRVRLVRAWRGLAIGLTIGGLLCAVWSALDWFGIFYAEWLWLGLLASTTTLLGAIWGAVLPIGDEALAESIDRRARLQDRLASARDVESGSMFDTLLVQDASNQLSNVRPARVFPIRMGRWQAGAATLTAIAAGIFLLGNTPLLLNDDQKHQLDELKAEGAKVERIIRENLDDPKAQARMSEKDRQLANDLMKLKRDVDKGRMTKEEALQRANEIAKQADELMHEHIQGTKDALKNADTALDSLRRKAMDQAGMKNADPNLMKMSDSQRESAMQDLEQQMSGLQNQMSAMQSQLNALQQKLKDPNLSDAERKKLDDQKRALEDAMKKAQDALTKAKDEYEQLKLSKEAQAVFDKMMNHPLYKKLQELAQKLAENAQQAEQTGQPKLTKEQREQLEKELEALAAKLKDDKEMEKYLQSLLDAMKESGGT